MQSILEFIVIYSAAYLNQQKRSSSQNDDAGEQVASPASSLSDIGFSLSSSSSSSSSSLCSFLPSLHVASGLNSSQFSHPFLSLIYQPRLSPLEDLHIHAQALEKQGRHSAALAYWRIAAEQGSAYVLYRMGNRHLWAWGMKYDETRAKELWLRSAEAGHVGGIACCQYFGIGRFCEDRESAFKLDLVLADQGDQDAMNKLGTYYEDANSNFKDEVKALHYYSLAAEKSHSVAQYNLANSLMNRKAAEQDVSRAIYYYRISAEAGIPKALFSLGVLYEEGIVLKKDRNEALNWYSRAAEMGHLEAGRRFGILMGEHSKVIGFV